MNIIRSLLLFLILIACSGVSCISLYAESHILSHNIEIEIDISGHTLTAKDSLTIGNDGQVTVQFSLNGGLRIDSVKIDGKDIKHRQVGLAGEGVEILIPPEAMQSKTTGIEFSYHGTIYEAITPESLKSHDPTKTTGIISEEGVYLSNATRWYPDIPGSLATYRVTALTPTGYEVVTLGSLVERRTIDGRLSTTWESSHPSDSLTLVAGRYQVKSIEHNGINIFTFFFPEEQGLADTYLKAVKRYLDMYEEMLGDYPYSKFAVVENFFPSGYGMPSYTLLGRTVVKLPFIVETSLGHEIAHNWWGNSVFCDDSRGNWCEGLTTYCADYYYKELLGPEPAAEYRREACRKYTSYVNEDNDFPLRNFTGRVDQASRAIGYGKATMVFHMMRKLIGDKPFFDALRLVYNRKIWQYTTWRDFQLAFEEVSGLNLDWYFEQWVDRKGAPVITLGKVESSHLSPLTFPLPKGERDGVRGSYKIEAELIQKGQLSPGADSPFFWRAFHLFVPVVLQTEGSELSQTIECTSPHTTFSFTTDSAPVALKVDPYNDLFRRLHYAEMPATLDSVLGDSDLIVTYPAGADMPLQGAYMDMVSYLLPDTKGVVMADRDITEKDVLNNSLLIMGVPKDNAVLRKLLAGVGAQHAVPLPEAHSFTLNGKEYSDAGAALLVCFKNPMNESKSICFFMGLDVSGVKLAGVKLVHYGKYSYLAFVNGRNVDKGVWEITESPLVYTFQ